MTNLRQAFRKCIRPGLHAAVLLTVIGAGPAAATGLQEESFRGIARNARGEIAYIEDHRLVYENGRHRRNQTRYFDPQGNEIARLNSEFDRHPYVPTYRFEDHRFGREDGARIQGGAVQVYGRASRTEVAQEAQLPLSDSLLTGQGLHFYIRDHLDELIRDGTVKKVEFLIPLTAETYTFRIRRIDSPTQRPGVVALRIESDHWLLRTVAPRLEVEYDLTGRRLLSYRGASNVLTDDQTVQDVVITYEYEDHSETPGQRL